MDVTLSGIKQSEKDKYCRTPFFCVPGGRQAHTVERTKEEVLLNGVSFTRGREFWRLDALSENVLNITALNN